MVETVISIVALVIAVASAAYTQESAENSKRANEISLHEKRLDLYKKLERHRLGLLGCGGWLPDMDLESFAGDVDLCEFYFPKEIYEKLSEIKDDLSHRWISQMLSKKKRPDYNIDDEEALELHLWGMEKGDLLQSECLEKIKAGLRITR